MTKILTPNSILVVKNRALGDALIGLSGLRYLRHQFPTAKITYAVPSWMINAFTDCDFIDEVIALDFKNIIGWMNTFQILSRKNFDLIIEFNQSGRSGNFFKIYSLLKSTPYFYHNHNFKNGNFVIDQGIRKPNTQKDLDLVFSVLKKLNRTSLVPQFKDFPVLLSKKEYLKDDQIIFGMVATRATKLWPVEHFLELAQLIKNKYPRIKIIIPVSSNSLDQKIKERIKALNFPSNCEIVELSLNELKDTLAKSKLYIGNDTGIKHFCVALKLPTISFFGPEEPFEWHPYDKNRHPYFFIEPLECRTKIAHFCGLTECSEMVCLRPITPQMVFAKMNELLPLA